MAAFVHANANKHKKAFRESNEKFNPMTKKNDYE